MDVMAGVELIHASNTGNPAACLRSPLPSHMGETLSRDLRTEEKQ